MAFLCLPDYPRSRARVSAHIAIHTCTRFFFFLPFVVICPGPSRVFLGRRTDSAPFLPRGVVGTLSFPSFFPIYCPWRHIKSSFLSDRWISWPVLRDTLWIYRPNGNVPLSPHVLYRNNLFFPPSFFLTWATCHIHAIIPCAVLVS